MPDQIWVMVRLRRETREQLRQLADQLLEASRRGSGQVQLREVSTPQHDGLSVDDVIQLLLRQRARWKARVAKARRGRRP